MVCKNCGTVYNGDFCPTCAQSARVGRFDMQSLLKESFVSSLDIETGLFGTLKELALRPGPAIRDYLNGKRLSLYVPAKFLLLIGAVATFLALRYNIFSSATTEYDFLANWAWYSRHFIGFWAVAGEYTTVINIIAIPIFTFATWLFFRPLGDNFAEHLVMNSYVVAEQLALMIVMFPFLEIFPGAKSEIHNAYILIALAYNIWVYITFFNMRNWTGFTLSIMAYVYAQLLTIIVTHLIYLFFEMGGLLKYLALEF